MKNLFKTGLVLFTLFGALTVSDAQSDKMKKQPQKDPQPIEALNKVVKYDDNSLISIDSEDQNDKVYTEVEELPQFKGGNEALDKWIGETIKYPDAAQKNKKEGIVTVQFIIEKDGKISNAVILEDEVGNGADKEVLQLLANMPYWSPGKINDKPVRVLHTLPVSFKL